MALSQIQIIQSLGEALAWYEKEIAWGAKPTALRHLTGRIGELYAAMITRGQMALDTNQQGYDVISAENERISVKTVTSGNHIKINENTIHHVDRVMVLRLNNDEDEGISIETFLDCEIEAFKERSRYLPAKKEYFLGTTSNNRPNKPLDNLQVNNEEKFGKYLIRQYENSTIKVLLNGNEQQTAKRHLREIAAEIGIDLLNSNGNEKNTRTLGADIIKNLAAKK